MRWRRLTGEVIGPDIFIPIAESNQLMEQITTTVLRLLEEDGAELLQKQPEFINLEASRRNLQLLRAAGIKLALDDFGSGYSSLSYLHSLEPDSLKIDKTFVDTIGKQTVTSEVIRHIIEMAKSLKLAMVAEGVETEPQAEFLRAQGVQYGQGWLFARPMSIGELWDRMEIQSALDPGPDPVPEPETDRAGYPL